MRMPFDLHAYNTSIRISIGATLNSLVYGMEAVLSDEVEITSLRILVEVEIEEAKIGLREI